MPENPTLPTPNQVFNKTSLPSPNDVFNQPTGLDKGFNPNELIQNQDKFNEVLNNIEDVSEDEKNIIKKLALAAHDGDKGVTSADVSDAILTLQRQHPLQDGGNKYYMKEVGDGIFKPIPIKNDEKPPKGYDVASIWGTQSSANDDTVVTSLGKHLWNGLVGAAEGVVEMSNLPYGAITGEEAPWYQNLKNSAKSLKANTPEYEQGEVFNTEGINSVSDFFDPARYDFSKDKVQGQVLNGLESLVSFLAGTKGVSGITKAATKAGKLGEAYVGSYAVNYGESLRAAENAGLTGRDKYAYAGITTVPTAALDVAFGTEGLFVKNQLARDGKKKMLESLAKGFKEDVGGKLTKESLEDLYKTTTAAATQLNKSFTRELGENILEEAGTESAQALVQNGAQMIYDQLSKDPKFNTDAFSLESIGEYLNSAIGGAFGAAGPGVVGVSQQRKKDKAELQNADVFGYIKEGKTETLLKNIQAAYKSGDLNQVEAANAITKINAYYDFNQQLGETKLPDAERKQVLDLAFQKELLYNSIKDTDKEKLSPIEMAKYESKATMAKDIQKQINDIVLKQEAEKEVLVGDKTTQDIAKKEEKKAEEGITVTTGKKESKVEKPIDERKFTAIPTIDWNTKKASDKFKILTRDLSESNEPIQGELTLETGGEGRTTNDTIHVKLPGNKFAITASSASDLMTKLRGHFKTEFVKGDIEGLPIVVKPVQLTSGKTVLGVYNEDNGKFISYVREDDKGNSKYSDAEVEQLQHLQAASKLTKGELEYYKGKRNPPQEGESGILEPKTPVTPVMPQGELKPIKDDTRQPIREGITTREEKSISRGVSETTEQNVETSKEEKKLRAGTKRLIQKIKSPERKKAVSHEVFSPYHAALQYFAGKGTISTEAIKKLYKGSAEEVFRRNPYVRAVESVGIRNAPSLEAVAQYLWENHSDTIPNATTEDYLNALEDAIQKNLTRNEMASELNNALSEKEQVAPTDNDMAMDIASEEADKAGVDNEFEAIANELEKKTTKELEELATDEKKFDEFGEEIKDIIVRDDIEDVGDVFQKPSELQYAETELKKAEKELKASKTAFDSKRKELGKEINNDQEDLFGERKSEEGAGLFDERVDMSAYEDVIAPFKDRYDAAVKAFNKAKDKVKELENSEDNQTSLFQNKALKAKKEAVEKIVERLRKVLPKDIKIVYDNKLKAAGKWSPKTRTITINPKFARKDTPIHEVGHILIDAMGGYNNRVIRTAIKQLEGTKLWKETASRYPLSKDYTIEDLGIEVLAEAIGREGAGIFDTVAEQNKFKQYLDYIFDWLKRKLGLEKNIAKSLAKQIISGIGTKNLKGVTTKEKLQKPKNLEEKSDKEIEYSSIGSFDAYRSKALNRNLQAIKKAIKKAKEKLADENISEEEAKGLQEILEYQANLEAQDRKAYMDYRNDMGEIKELMSEKEIHEYSEEELFKIYNNIINYQKFSKGTLLPDVMRKIGMALFDKQANALKNNPKTKEMFDDDLSKIKDLTSTEVKMKVLSHMNQYFPELQSLNKLYDSAVFAKEKESKENKFVLEKLGKKVIEEKNKQLGITDKASSVFSSDSAKYFEYLDNGEGEYLTVNEAKKKGLSEAQIEFLKYMRELVAERQGLMNTEVDVDNMIMEVIKTDKGFRETYKDAGLVSAYSHLLGDTYNINNVRIPYTNPITGKSGVTEFKNIEKILIDYGKQGLPQMVKALALLTKYNWRARKQLKIGKNYDQKGEENKLKVIVGGDYTLDANGNLIGKFDRKRDKDRGYSKDFYKAAMMFIDDTAHVKHMTPLMPAINSIMFINENGVLGEGGEELHGKKPNVVKWMEEWRDMHVFKKEKETIPELDLALKMLRFMTSATTMWFNVPAGAMNLSIGLYNNWRAQTDPIIRRGNGRLFLKGARKGERGYAFGALNPYAVDLIRKYNVVSTDIDSNPKIFAGRIFDTIANGATRFGEFIIQGSGVLGLMDEDLYNSFEYKKDKHGVEQLVVKEGLDEKEIEKKILALRNRISDIQGKYADKDKRNFANNELGKAVMQFKTWIPDFWKERFGKPYINSDGEYRQGSVYPLMKDGFKDLRAEFKKLGVDALKANTPDAISFRQNLKGLMAITLLSILANTGDDDEEKSLAVKMASRGRSDILFIFNPTDQGTLKFTLSKPIAAMGNIEKFIDAADHLLAFESDDYYKATDNPKIGRDLLRLAPGRKLIEPAVDFMLDDDE